MFEFFYNIFLGIYLFSLLPVVIFNFKKYRSTIVGRLFFLRKNILSRQSNLSETVSLGTEMIDANSLEESLCRIIPKDKKVIWIHAVSLGETKVASLLAKKLKEENNDLFLILSTVTKTGFAEGKKTIPFADVHLFLPLDFSFVMKKMMSFFQPKMVILIETDFWYNFLKYAKLNGATTVLVNGKLSEGSFKRYKTFAFFSKRLFSLIDLFLVQDNQYLKRFLKLNIPQSNIHVTGNLKFDLKNKKLSKEQLEDWRRIFKLKKDEKIVTIASTHFPEEELLLKKLDYHYKYFLVPRHPERFSQVKELLNKSGIPFGSYSDRNNLSGSEKIILIDTMGFLNRCYELSSLAVVGGSFIKKVGGHNILEPVFVETPVFFGPYMHSQEEMRNIVLKERCGEQVSLENIGEKIAKFFREGAVEQKENCKTLNESFSGQVDKTYSLLKKYY